ncbi:cytidine deaminase [Citrobacter freundii]|nr:cytidine deaminase [Citrobacter freundii]
MHPRFQTAFAQLAGNVQSALAPLLADVHFPAMLTAEQVSLLKRESGLDEDALAFALLPLAAACARTDLSHFNVGAIARGVSGNWYFGGNMEFLGATMQQTVHAEQSAISHAWLRGEKGLAAITVNYTPCGHCRQFMNELNSGLDLRIHLPGREPHALRDYLPDAFGPKDLDIKTLLMDEQDHGFALQGDALTQAAIAAANRCHMPGREPHALRDYLPDAFGPKDLDIKTLLMDEQDHGFALQGDALTQAAIAAANRCHMPYSNAPSGVALECKDGQIFSGSYAENAAFNPTLPPLQGALNLLNLNGYDYPDIQSAVLAEKADAPLIQWDATAATLKALGCNHIERVLLA